MNPKLILYLALVLSGGLFGCLFQSPAQTNSMPDFSRYEQTEAFRFFVSAHTNRADRFAATNLLAITSFLNRDRVALCYHVRGDGRESDCRWVYDWAVQSYHEKQLSPGSIKRLRSAIGELPAKSEQPPVGRLVLVSFSDGTNWITRSYDNKALPEAVRQILDVIGERTENPGK